MTRHIGRSGPGGRSAPLHRRVPGLAALAAVVAFNAWYLRGELRPGHYLHDGSFHRLYLQWAVERLSHGHSPLDGILPQLGLGFPLFEHYQISPYLLTAPVAWLFGVEGTFTAVLYLLLVLWPVCVYAMVRMLGFDRTAAVAAGVVAPFVMSVPGYGFELPSYVWRGYGMWTQAWGMWLLALGVGVSWRAVTQRRSLALAAAIVALLLTSHLLTGLLLVAVVVPWALLAGGSRRTALRRALVILGAGAVASAWLLVPSFVDRGGTDFTNPAGTHWRDSYGVRKVLGWLVTGELFDAGRFPVITLLAGVGVVALAARCRRSTGARAVLALAGVSLALFCGTTVVGPVLDRLPAREVLFLHRAISGVHLAGLVLAGVGAAVLLRLVPRLAAWSAARGAVLRRVAVVAAPAGLVHRVVGIRLVERVGGGVASGRRGPRLAGAARAAGAICLGVVALTPGWRQLAGYLDEQTTWIDQQRQLDATDGRDFAQLVALAQEQGGGRIYAGSRGGWGEDYTVGFVAAYVELTNMGVPGFGFTGRVPTLVGHAEGIFDGNNLAMVDLFDIRWHIRPADEAGPPGGTFVASRGRHNLWRVDTSGPVRLGDSTSVIPVGEAGPGVASDAFLQSQDALAGRFPLLDLAGDGDLTPTAGPGVSGPPGSLVGAHADPSGNRYTATVDTARNALLVVKTSYHPRWTARVDGRPASTRIVAPGLLGVELPAGARHVDVRFTGFPLVPRLALVALGAGVLAVLVWADRAGRRRRTAAPARSAAAVVPSPETEPPADAAPPPAPQPLEPVGADARASAGAGAGRGDATGGEGE